MCSVPEYMVCACLAVLLLLIPVPLWPELIVTLTLTLADVCYTPKESSVNPMSRQPRCLPSSYRREVHLCVCVCVCVCLCVCARMCLCVHCVLLAEKLLQHPHALNSLKTQQETRLIDLTPVITLPLL